MEVAEPDKRRRMFVVLGGLYAAAAVALFVFRPIPPLGLDAAVGFAVAAVINCYGAFFPRHLVRLAKRLERDLGKNWSTHLGRWVP